MRVTIRPLGLQQAAVALIVLATATCDSEPTSPPGPRPQVRPVADVVIFHARNRVSPPVSDTLIVGDTLRLAAAATDANGHVVLGVQFAWMSSDTLVAVVDAAGLVTGIGSGEAEVTATTAGKTGRLDLTVFVGQPPGRAYGRVVLPGHGVGVGGRNHGCRSRRRWTAWCTWAVGCGGSSPRSKAGGATWRCSFSRRTSRAARFWRFRLTRPTSRPTLR